MLENLIDVNTAWPGGRCDGDKHLWAELSSGGRNQNGGYLCKGED